MQLHTGFKVKLAVSGTDVDGNAVTIDPASITAFSDNPDMVSVEVSTTSPEITVTDNPTTGLGSALVTVNVGGLSVTENVEVIAGDATVVSLTAGTEEPR